MPEAQPLPSPSRAALIWAVALSSAPGGMLGAALWADHSADRRLLHDAAQQQAQAVATLAASRIDADALARGLSAAPNEGAFARWDEAPDDLWIQRSTLLDIQQSLPAETRIDVVQLNPSGAESLRTHPHQGRVDGVELLLSTGETPNWRSPAPYEPALHHSLLTGDHPTALRSRTSDVLAQAGAPIRDASGRVVAALAIHSPLATAQSALEDELLGRAAA